MPFSHVQSGFQSILSSTFVTITISAAPGTGHLVCVALTLTTAVTAFVVHDGNNNSYTVTSGSPLNDSAGSGAYTYMAYLLSAPSSASASITASWTGTAAFASIMVDEFSVSGGTASFDREVKSTPGVTASGTSITTPSITPSAAGELLYSMCAPTHLISAPTTGGTSGAWTGGALDTTNGPGAEYILSCSAGSTAVSYTGNTSGDHYAAMAMAFTVPTPAAVGFAFRQQIGVTNNGSNLLTISATLPLTPLPGSVLLFCLFTPEFYNGLVVKDGNGNTYIETPHSQAASTTCYLIAPSNANATVTATWGSPGSSFISLQIYEFSVSAGRAFFDSDANSNGTLPSGGALTLPVIPVHGANELLFGQMAVSQSFLSPFAGQVQNGWTGLGLTGNGDCPEYMLAASSNTAVSGTGNTTGDSYHSLGVSFGFIPGTPAGAGGSQIFGGQMRMEQQTDFEA